ncbi:hypothetical protein CLF_106012 [Clonorchis sinensis]|uniref:Uncharacterized protein n=1 Tax=Clonorchis sinensis TaxID=79923 RepID=G7YEJ6_CLOSI|nr:hypothetical protein CLF_106012 [Clonorchis sinensis]
MAMKRKSHYQKNRLRWSFPSPWMETLKRTTSVFRDIVRHGSDSSSVALVHKSHWLQCTAPFTILEIKSPLFRREFMNSLVQCAATLFNSSMLNENIAANHCTTSMQFLQLKTITMGVLKQTTRALNYMAHERTHPPTLKSLRRCSSHNSLFLKRSVQCRWWYCFSELCHFKVNNNLVNDCLKTYVNSFETRRSKCDQRRSPRVLHPGLIRYNTDSYFKSTLQHDVAIYSKRCTTTKFIRRIYRVQTMLLRRS